IAFTPGMGKFLFRPLALSVTFAMVASYILAMTIVPSRCATWLKPHVHAESQHGPRRRRISFRRGVEKVLAFVVRIYERVLRLALRHPKPILSVVGVLFLGSLALLLF